MDKAEKRIVWKKHLADWSSSRLSQKAYCAQHGLKLANFSYWRKSLRASEPSRAKLIPITVPPRASSVRLMALGVQMDVPVEVLEQVLPVVWRSLRETA
jgi:hypothetical protein